MAADRHVAGGRPCDPGRCGSKANSWTVHFAPLPAGVRIDSPEGPLSFSPVGAAKVTPTVTAPDTVTYANVWPGVDLRYQVLSDEVKETIVLNNRPTASTFTFLSAGMGFTAGAGGSLVPQRAKSNWTLAAPVIEDQQGTPLPNTPVTLSPVGKAANAGVTVMLSAAWLAAQPSGAYPILVDPTAVYGSSNMTAYKSDGTTCSACGLQVGNPNQSNGTFDWRSVGYFDYSALFGQHISNATVSVSGLAGGTANGYSFGVWLPTAYSYAGAIGGGEEASGTVDTQGSLTRSALTAQFDYWVHNSIAGALGFTGYETAGLYTYKHLNNFTLSLTAFSTAPTAAQNPTASATPDGILHASWTPPADNGGAPVTYIVNLYHSGGGAPANSLTTSGTSVTWSGLGDDTSWYFGVTAENSAGSSGEVDTSIVSVTHPPGMPTTLMSYPGNGAAYITWSAPADPGGTPIDNYVLAAVDETNPNHPQTAAITTCCSGLPITGLTNGHAYAIVVYAHDHDGYSPTPAVSSGNAYVTPSTNPPPYPVQQVYWASAANGAANLTWRPPLTTNGGAAVTNYVVTAYDIVTGYHAPQRTINSSTATSFNFPGLTNGRSYLFAISAGNPAGYTSVFTNTVTPSSTPPPNPVTNATAQPGDNYAVLQWTQPAGPAATSYVIWLIDDTNPANPAYLGYTISQSSTPSYVWNGSATGKPLTAGTPYLFYIWAENASGVAAPGATNTVTPQNGQTGFCLLNPCNVQATPADTTAVISWTAPTLSALLTISYTVEAHNTQTGSVSDEPSPPTTSTGAGPCATGSNTDPPVVASPPSPCFIFTGLTNGSAYYFIVKATVAGIIPLGVSTKSTTVTPAGRPFPPANISVTNATTAGAAAMVTWTPPPTQSDGVTPGNDGSTIMSYTLTATPATGSNPNASTESVTYTVPNPLSATYVDTIPGLLNASPYNITVTATNIIGTSDPSPPVPFSPTGLPSAPVMVVATPGPAQATVTWQPPPAQPNGVPGDNGSPITDYTLTTHLASDGSLVGAPLQTASLSQPVPNLTPGTSYYFTVSATNALGTSPASAPSNPINPIGPPAAPTDVHAAAGDGSAQVNWAPSVTYGSPVLYYTVTTSPGNATQNTPDGSTTTITISGVTDGTAYTFTVLAHSAAGDSSVSASSSPITPEPIQQVGQQFVDCSNADSYNIQCGIGYTIDLSTFSTTGIGNIGTLDGSANGLFGIQLTPWNTSSQMVRSRESGPIETTPGFPTFPHSNSRPIATDAPAASINGTWSQPIKGCLLLPHRSNSTFRPVLRPVAPTL